MPSYNQILDTPTTKKQSKIRKFYYWFLELCIVGYYLFLIVLAAANSFSIPPMYGDSFLVSYLVLVLALILMVLLFIGYLALAVLPLNTHATIFYEWRKTSLAYDKSFDKTLLEQFDNAYLDDVYPGPFWLSLFVPGMIAFLLITIGFVGYWSSNFSLFKQPTTLEDIFLIASTVYSIISCYYLFMIRRSVRRAL